MAIDRDSFISAGINYIYQLDDYPEPDVYDQIASEFDEILDLNKTQVLEQRAKFIGIGQSSDYKNHLIKTDDGYVVAGIRHLGGDRNTPFVLVWPSFKIKSTKTIVDSIAPYFEVFKPGILSYWCRPDCNDSNGKVIQNRFIGKIAEMYRSDLRLTFVLARAGAYYEWYKAEYEKFHLENPEYKNRITINSKELMDASLKEDLLFLLHDDDRPVGLIAGQKEIFLRKPAVYLNEIVISQQYRKKGYAKELLAGFINILTADYFLSDIDSENIPSTRAAIRSGQTVFSQEVFVQI